MTDTQTYQRADAAHHLHPFTDTLQLGTTTRIIQRADGIHLWDSEGNQILDGMSGLWCVNIGYGRRDIREAINRQLTELPYYNSFFQCTTPRAIELAQTLSDLAPDGFNYTFFTGSGSEANDTVIRIIRRHWQLLGQPQRTIIISRHNAYHGSTLGGASLGGMPFMHAQGGLPIPDIVHIRQPHHFAEGRGQTEEQFGETCAQALADKIEQIGPHRIAAFIGEPVQGAGGVIVPPPNYWPRIQQICDTAGIPIIADEVICGFGRLGHWFGSQHFGIRPKLIPIAKGLTSGYLPMGGVMVHDDIAEVIIRDGGEFAHGFTYSGHPVCAAAALANLHALREEKIIERLNDGGIIDHFQTQWRTLGDHPLVAETRGIGMVAALELAKEDGTPHLPDHRAGALCRDLSLANGLVMRAVRDSMIIAPPLIISKEQIDELIGKAGKTLDDLRGRV